MTSLPIILLNLSPSLCEALAERLDRPPGRAAWNLRDPLPAPSTPHLLLVGPPPLPPAADSRNQFINAVRRASPSGHRWVLCTAFRAGSMPAASQWNRLLMEAALECDLLLLDLDLHLAQEGADALRAESSRNVSDIAADWIVQTLQTAAL